MMDSRARSAVAAPLGLAALLLEREVERSPGGINLAGLFCSNDPAARLADMLAIVKTALGPFAQQPSEYVIDCRSRQVGQAEGLKTR